MKLKDNLTDFKLVSLSKLVERGKIKKCFQSQLKEQRMKFGAILVGQRGKTSQHKFLNGQLWHP